MVARSPLDVMSESTDVVGEAVMALQCLSKGGRDWHIYLVLLAGLEPLSESPHRKHELSGELFPSSPVFHQDREVIRDPVHREATQSFHVDSAVQHRVVLVVLDKQLQDALYSSPAYAKHTDDTFVAFRLVESPVLDDET
jgi:hypothetical protein